jgi:hypothetical protein
VEKIIYGSWNIKRDNKQTNSREEWTIKEAEVLKGRGAVQ